MSTASNRAKLCDNIDKIIDEFGLDGTCSIYSICAPYRHPFTQVSTSIG
jgi:hypothetical protein